MRGTAREGPGPGVRPLAIAVAACFSLAVHANPTGPTVVSGSAAFRQAGNLLQVTNSPSAIINWQSFSIGAGEITKFIQQSSQSSVLNRVTTQNPSSILGTLQSNGRVFLINPNGIVFGRGSVIDTAGLVASSLNLSNADFLSGRLNFTSTPGAGSVINQGNINTGSGGSVYLVGPAVTNAGIITSPKGEVVLAAGNSVELVNPGTPNLRVEITAPDNHAVNLGQISAESGRVGIYAGLINHTGSIRADRAVATEDGRIVLAATKLAILEEGSTISASGGSVAVDADRLYQAGTVSTSDSGGSGGTVRLSAQRGLIQTESARVHSDGADAGGTISVTAATDGTLFSSGTMSATGATGGRIELTAGDIRLFGARVDTSGTASGGTVHVGGGWQGGGALPHASSVIVNPASELRADARESGSGGEVVVWSDNATRFAGLATARGGPKGGDGGRIEVSSKTDLTFAGVGNASAPSGRAGSLLLDPKNIIINDATTGTVVGGVSATPWIDPHAEAGNQFGYSVTMLDNGNVVVTAPFSNFGAPAGGAVYLFNGGTGAVLGALFGSNEYDRIGQRDTHPAFTSGIVRLKGANSNNFLVVAPYSGDPYMNPNQGSVTWMSGSSGSPGSPHPPGILVSASNSVVGGWNDRVDAGTLALADGNYIVTSDKPIGAGGYTLTWMNGANGRSLVDNSYTISSLNSIVGMEGGLTTAYVGSYLLPPLMQLPVNGHLVVASTNGKTWINGSQRTGTTDPQRTMGGDIFPLTNGNYVIGNPSWNGGEGAATWVNGSTGLPSGGSNTISELNSLVGTTRLSINGLVSFRDKVASGVGTQQAGIVALANGNYVVLSGGYANVGAVTWGNGNGGTVGVLDPAASLVAPQVMSWGTSGVVGYRVVPLANRNGDYVVSSDYFDSAGVRNGYATWVSGINGRPNNGQRLITAANSLVNGEGRPELVGLSNGNYVVIDTAWNSVRGAVTLGDGAAGTTGIVSAANSIVGSLANDRIGGGMLGNITLDRGSRETLRGSIVEVGNGNFVIISPDWHSYQGAVTFVDGVTGRVADYAANGNTNVVSSANSLVGSASYDRLSVTPLLNGNYVVASPGWNNNRGAVTLVDGATGRVADHAANGNTNVISAANSLVGGTAGDRVGTYAHVTYFGTDPGTGFCSRYGCNVATPTVTAIANGDYVVGSPHWSGNKGALTWASGTTGMVGAITAANSLVGNSSGDLVGADLVIPLGASSVLSGNPFAGTVQVVRPALTSAAIPLPQLFTMSPSSDLTINRATLTDALNAGTSVTLQANNNITLEAGSDIVASAGGAGIGLTMQAGHSILLNSSIATGNAALTLVANEASANPNTVVAANRDNGAAVITQAAGTTISTGSGAISITIADGAGRSGTQAASGDITLASVSTTGGLTVRNSGPNAGGIVLGGDLRAGSATLIADAMNLERGTLQATIGAVTLQQKNPSTSIQLGAGAADALGVLGIDQTELSNIQSANGLVIGASEAGTTGGINVVGAVTLSGPNLSGGTLTLQSDSGDIAFGAAGALSTVGRAVTLSTPGGAILGNGGATTNVSGSSLAANANKGITLTTSVATLNANNIGTSAAGSINIENAQALNVTGIANAASGGAITVAANGAGNDLSISGTTSATGAATVTLTAGRDIQGGTSAGNDVVTAGAWTANAGRGIGTTNALRTSTGSSGTLSLTADGTGAAASIFVVEANALATSRVTAGGAGAATGRTVSLTSSALTIDTNFGAVGDSLVLSASAQNIARSGAFTLSGSSIDLNAVTGIGSLLAPIQTATATVSARNAGPTGSVVITNAGNVSVSGSNTGVGAFNAAATGAGKTLTVNTGNINAHAGSVTLTGDVLALQGAVTGDGGVTLKPYSTGAVIGVENAAQAFNVTGAMLGQVTSSTGVTVGASANTGGIVARGDNAISTGLGLALLTGGSILLADNAAPHTNGIAAKSLALTADANNDGTGSISRTANNEGRLSTSAGSLALVAAQGIGSTAMPILTSATSVDAKNSTSGDVVITSADAASVTGRNTGPGVFNVALGAGKLLSIGGDGIVSNGGAVNLTADMMAIIGTVNAGSGLISAKPVTMTGTVIKIGGAEVDANSVLVIDSTEATNFFGTGGLTISSTGTAGIEVVGATPFTHVTGGTVTLGTAGAITRTGTGSISTGGANLALNAVSGIGKIDANNRGIDIGTLGSGSVSARNSTSGDLFLNFTGGGARNVGGTSGIEQLAANGNLRFDAAGPMEVTGNLDAGTGSITLNPTGALTRSGGTLTADIINLGTAGTTTSIGAADAGRVRVAAGAGGLMAKAKTGGIFLEQASGDMATSGYKLDVPTANQAIELATTNGKITVDHNYTTDWNPNTQNANLFLFAQGAGKDIIGNGTATLKTSGSITLNASGGIGTTSALRTATTGNMSLTTRGIDGTGNITLVETLNPLNTNQILSVGTDASTQTVSITAPSITAGTGGIGNSADNLGLTASGGNIAGTSGTVTAKNLMLNAVTGIGDIGSNTGINAASDSVTATNSTSGDMFLNFTTANQISVGGPSSTISQFSGGNLRFDSGGPMQIAGDMSAGAGSLTLNPTGNLTRSAGTLTADTINLGTRGTTTEIGATAAGRIRVAGSTGAPTVTAGATHGLVFLEQTNLDLLTSRYTLNAGRGASIAELATTSGTIIVDGNLGAFALTVSASGGDIAGGAGVLGADDLVLNATGGIGIGAPVKMDGLRTLSLTTGGAGALGNIDVRAVNSLDTGRIAISTNPAASSTVQAVSLGSDGSIAVNAGIIAAGDLKLDAGVDIYVNRPITAGNNLSLAAGRDLNIRPLQNVTAGNDLSLTAGNSLLIDESIVTAGNMASVTARDLLVVGGRSGSAQLVGIKGINVATAWSTGLQGGFYDGAFAEIAGGATGALNISTSELWLLGGAPGAYARLLGNPDVTLMVREQIRMRAGEFGGGYAGIGAVSPTTIYVNFPNRSSGGYVVNGVESVVFDPATASGFVAGGLPAVLGRNLIVTYGAIPPLNGPNGLGGSEALSDVRNAMSQPVTGLNSITWPGDPGPTGAGAQSNNASSNAAASCSDQNGVVTSGVCVVQ